MEVYQVRQEIGQLHRYWYHRNRKFQDWYEYLILVDILASKGMETYVSNEPQTFYNMAHYLLTRGDISHTSSVENETALELERRAKLHRACDYQWQVIDRDLRKGGEPPFIDNMGFFLLVLGWLSTAFHYDQNTGKMAAQVWNPYDVYPRFSSGSLQSLVHTYTCSDTEAREKADSKGWDYTRTVTGVGESVVDDYFVKQDDTWYNMVFIDGQNVTGWVDRPDMELLVSPIGGFPDRGSLTRGGSLSARTGKDWRVNLQRSDWRRLVGRGIFEVNMTVGEHFNKWKSMVTQILRDTAQPLTQEMSATPKATPEQLRERGALFHYAPGEGGIQRVPPPAIPIEIQANLLELRREYQKGSFNDAVYGMVEGRQAGYALSLLASSSANQILYPYMDAKHFVISEADKFWLTKHKASGRVFEVKGAFLEKLQPTDIPKDVVIRVESSVATPRDLMEQGTIANMMDKHYDRASILSKVYEENDPQGIIRKRRLQQVLDHPMSLNIEMIAAWRVHAKYLERRGDPEQAVLFRRAAIALESQIGAPEPGQGKPVEASRIEAERKVGAPEERARIAPEVASPESVRGFTPAELRRTIGRGTIRRV